MTALDLVIQVEQAWLRGAPKWRVAMESVVTRSRELVDPLRDEDIGSLRDVPSDVTTWRELGACFTPGGAWTPPLPVMKAIGKLIHRRLLAYPSFERHLAEAERRAQSEGRLLRVLFELEPSADDDESVLPWLPLELAHDDRGFALKQPGRGVLRADPRASARSLALPRRGVALLATAHDDRRPPTRASLEAHRAAIAAAIEDMGWRVVHVPDASSASLEEALLHAGERVDVLYVACHGLDDPSYGGQLLLRDGQLSGERLGQWLESASRAGRPVGAALLCACSSAAPERGENTSGMAQWLAQDGRAHTSLGFRGPVGVDWALRFVERMFQRSAESGGLERAFVETRGAERNEDPAWTLPLLYVRRSDAGATLGPSDAPDDAPGSRDAAMEFALRAWGFGAGEAEARDAAEIVRRIGQPALHDLAAATIAAEQLSAGEFLESLTARAAPEGGPAVLGRSLVGISDGDRRFFFALCEQPGGEAPLAQIARQLHQPEPSISAKLFRLAKRGLVTVTPSGAYAIPEALREAARPLEAASR